MTITILKESQQDTRPVRFMDLLRRIRDEGAERLQSMDAKEIQAFFHEAGERARRQAEQRRTNSRS